jgi:hypothetical protein
MSSAFVPIVRTRPCPIFGRPVHPRGSPDRLQPDTSPQTLRISDRSEHPVLRENARGWLQVHLGCVRLSPSCPFRLLHTCPSLPGQRGITPAFEYSAPHSSAEGTLTPKIHALPSAHYGRVRLLQIVHRRLRLLAFPPRTIGQEGPLADPETSRFPCMERACVPGSSTTLDRPSARVGALGRIAFRYTDSVDIQDQFSIAAQWLACTFPYRRFADILADACARLEADVVRYSFIVVDLHHLLLAGLPAHPCENASARE